MENKATNKLVSVLPFDSNSYEPVSLTSLSAYSVFWLSKWELRTTMENLAVLNFKLFPTKFAMVGWPQFPDVNRTNRSVLQMRPKYRNLATSITNKGIFLNDHGVAEAEGLIRRLGTPSFAGGEKETVPIEVTSSRGTSRARTVHPEDLVATVRKSRMYQMFQSGEWNEVEAIDLINFLGVYDHTPSKEKRRRLTEFQEAAQEISDKDISKFLEETESRFRYYLHKKEA